MNNGKDDFLDIDVSYVRERLKECGIENGVVVNADALTQSAFIQQVMKDVQEVQAQVL